MTAPEQQVILGIDPGTRISGYGVIAVHHRAYKAIDYGCIRPPGDLKLSERYWVIFESVGNLIVQYRPTALVVETQYVQKNVQSALKLGMARGAVMIAAKQGGVPVFAYAPAVAKRAVTGNGRASKCQVQGMVQNLLQLAVPPHPKDAADALALALCHADCPFYLQSSHEV